MVSEISPQCLLHFPRATNVSSLPPFSRETSTLSEAHSKREADLIHPLLLGNVEDMEERLQIPPQPSGWQQAASPASLPENSLYVQASKARLLMHGGRRSLPSSQPTLEMRHRPQRQRTMKVPAQHLVIRISLALGGPRTATTQLKDRIQCGLVVVINMHASVVSICWAMLCHPIVSRLAFLIAWHECL